MKTISLSKYFEIIKPKYVYLKLIPHSSIRNYNSSNIAKAIHYMQKSISQRIKKEEKKLIFETQVKCSYLIDIYKDKVEFYFIIPQQYTSIAKEKIKETWNKVTIEEVENIASFSYKCLTYELSYRKEDALSLDIDKKSNEPLNHILNVIDIMQDDDRVSIFYNFMPIKQFGWLGEYDSTVKKLKTRQPIEKQKTSSKYIGKLLLTNIIELLDGFLEVTNDIMGGNKKTNDNGLSLLDLAITTINTNKDLSEYTKKKRNNIILNTQMLILSESKDKTRIDNNAVSVCQSYKSIDGDNELIYKRVKNKDININNFKLPISTNKMTIDECKNLIQLPGRELLEEYKIINHVNTLEISVPKELCQGTMCIGEVKTNNNIQKAYLSSDKEFKNLTLCLIAPTRAGKTTLISNIARDSINANETTILFDFCGNCELSDDVSSVVKKTLNIDCSKFDTLQGLGYNEIKPLNDNIFEIYRCSKTKTSQLMTLVNSINSDDSDLKARMERYLEASAVIVFISNGSIKEVFDVLQNHSLRHKYIDNIPNEQLENLEEYIKTLEELDEWSKATKDNPSELVGTKLSFVQGILNRVAKLKQNTYMELMLKQSCENNINLVNEMQKSQLICIRMPEVMFSTEQEKDIYCTYWLTKIWGALQVRKWNIPDAKNRVKVNIVFDELYQVPNCQDFLRSKLSQIAKFSCKPIISCHYLGQISLIRNELKAANSSYMLISGCDKDNFRELKEELYPYELEDLLNLKRYYSLNLIKYEGGWAKFISKLPKPIK